MFGETHNLKDNKSLKDTSSSSNLTIKDIPFSFSYNKTNKLVAGLYMVTDILDKEEPIRNRLRILGAGVISDISNFHLSVRDLNIKIIEILSFLDIASSVGIVSQMNSSILKKEFLLLQESIEEASQKVGRHSPVLNSHLTLSEFMRGGSEEFQNTNGRNITSIGHRNSTRLGVQKGHTLMKALSDRALASSGKITMSDKKVGHFVVGNFNILKKERREEILKIVKKAPNGVTITDIRTQAQSLPLQAGGLASCGEKTLQRELISMVKDRVLNKTGEKRWSRYFLAN